MFETNYPCRERFETVPYEYLISYTSRSPRAVSLGDNPLVRDLRCLWGRLPLVGPDTL